MTTPTTTAANITDSQIASFADAAAAHGDLAGYKRAMQALAGNRRAVADVVRWLRDGEAAAC